MYAWKTNIKYIGGAKSMANAPKEIETRGECQWSGQT